MYILLFLKNLLETNYSFKHDDGFVTQKKNNNHIPGFVNHIFNFD